MNEIIRRFGELPWFQRIGMPSPRDREVYRIYSWDLVPSPESPESYIQSLYHRQWYDSILMKSGDDRGSIERLFDSIRESIFQIVRQKIPYCDEEDVWYAPNAAACSAAFNAALAGCYYQLNGYYPEDQQPASQWSLAEECYWYVNGHWPCSFYWSYGYAQYDEIDKSPYPKRLIVY